MVQFLDDIYRADSFEKGILKFIGFTVEISRSRPSRRAEHWVEIDLDNKALATNSSLIKEALGQKEVEKESSLSDFARKRIYTVLDSLDFSVQLYR